MKCTKCFFFSLYNYCSVLSILTTDIHTVLQLQSLGFSYDWDREISTTEPEYYKWTQWIFLQLLKSGLAYQVHIYDELSHIYLEVELTAFKFYF